ncbi:hypothetical protein BHU72_01120 [Desulfuribacillus stibiiarsenatis]|uniref:YibE/F family protein n=1 Tax=Desulfuribacillus stibiiarsenatis TaxID=1390249 RepID=A0A1E5LA23_9FIRM|nr:YibE/F family protein [Desulfuribacillus stibiiarsenatis]OEH86894.1 hypothetical protein BHU72_01120 [Desulfuribacillus stibiiarsenatis]
MNHRFLAIVLILTFLVLPTSVLGQTVENLEVPTEHVKGRVIKIIEEKRNFDYGGGMKADMQRFEVEILDGTYKGKIIESENMMFGNPAYDLWVKEGDRILMFLEEQDGVMQAHMMDFIRDRYIYLLVAAFILLLILIGRMQGVKSVITLGLTVLIIGKVMLPLLFQGYSPVPLALITGLAVSTITFLIVCGFTKKTLAASLGTLGGLTTAALLSIFISSLANLKGLSGEEAQMLLYIPQEITFNFRGLLLAGIIIGALGAVMDVSISIASAMEEIHKKSMNLSFKELINSGMNVGKDIMGTMSNTLILAYTGASIPLFLLLMAYEQPFIKLMNMDFLATELVRALSGSIGLIFAIPITAIISGFLLRPKSDHALEKDHQNQ